MIFGCTGGLGTVCTGDSTAWVVVLAGIALGVSAVVIVLTLISKKHHKNDDDSK